MHRSWSIGLLAALALIARAARAEELAYVIKVTPALVYLDAGARAGAAAGDIYAVLRPQEQGGHVLVGLVSLIRVEEGFSIAEIGYTAAGERFEILQRAMPLSAWEAMSPAPGAAEHGPATEEVAAVDEEQASEAMEVHRFSLHLMGGMEWGKGTAGPKAERLRERSLGLGLGLEVGKRVGLELGFEVVGESPDERTQVVAEGSGRLFLFGSGRVGPYLGAGVGLHRLSWEGDSALKWGGRVQGGVHVPHGRWSLMAGGGYQWVAEWSGTLDVSGWVSQAGMGMHF